MHGIGLPDPVVFGKAPMVVELATSASPVAGLRDCRIDAEHPPPRSSSHGIVYVFRKLGVEVMMTNPNPISEGTGFEPAVDLATYTRF